MATRADIEVNVKGLKKVQELSKLLDKVSGKVNQLNQGAGSAAKNNKLEKESLKLQEDKRASMVRVRNVGDKIAVAKERGFKVDKASRALNRAALSNSQGKFKLARAQANAANNLLKTEIAITKEDAKQLRFEKLLASIRGSGARGGARPPGRGGGGFGGALSSAAVSGAFPLLFGQGPAAAAGGFGGGLIGSALGGQMGGFAGGLIGTTVVSTFQEQVLGLANALDPLNADIDAAIEKVGGLSSARKQEIKIIEQFRGKQAALEEITKDLTKVVGEDGVEAFKELREAAKLFTDKFSDFALKLKSKAADIVNDLRELLDPGGLDLGKAQQGLQSIEDDSIERLIKALNSLEKEISKEENQGFLSNLGPFPGTKGFERSQDKQFLQEEARITRDQTRLTAAFKAGEIINKKAGAELENRKKATKLELEDQKRLNDIRTEGRFVISKGLAEELLALDKLNEKRTNALNDEKKRAEGIINQLEGKKALTNEESKLFTLANLTLLSVEEQITANEQNFEKLRKNTLEARKLQNAANETVDAFENLNTTIQNDIKQGIAGLIKGTSTLSDLLNNVADRFLDLALNQGLFGNAGGKTVTGGLFKLLGFADGGRPPVNRPSIVGEKGPELFVPRSSGNIIPNNKLGGSSNTSVTVNVDASGSSVEGDESDSEQLGRLIGAAVQAELIKESRPGGLLALQR